MYTQTLKREDIANVPMSSRSWLVIKAALANDKLRELVWFRVSKDQERIIMALSKYQSWIVFHFVASLGSLSLRAHRQLLMSTHGLTTSDDLRAIQKWLTQAAVGALSWGNEVESDRFSYAGSDLSWDLSIWRGLGRIKRQGLTRHRFQTFWPQCPTWTWLWPRSQP